MRPQSNKFSFNRSGTTGCEIRGPDGLVIAWTVDETWAAVIAALLNSSPNVAVAVGAGMLEAASCCGGADNRKNTLV